MSSDYEFSDNDAEYYDDEDMMEVQDGDDGERSCGEGLW